MQDILNNEADSSVKNIVQKDNWDLSNFLDEFESTVEKDTEQTSHLMGGADATDGNEGDAVPVAGNEAPPMTSGEARENRKKMGEFINPALAVNIADIVMSRLLSYGINMIGQNTSYKDFKLDTDEKNALKQPLADYLGTFDFKMDTPLGNLMLVLSIVYGGKLIAVYAQDGSSNSDQAKAVRSSAKQAAKKVSNEIENDPSIKTDGQGRTKLAFLTEAERRDRLRMQKAESARKKRERLKEGQQ